ncbi:type II toxin-antitoxin system Phd/YefM family antitoxin [Dankookia sp. P2]|uniref:type II toxin-antitoxin system Phd/YefM family antitoxin n=1 Tax=Dankookia sp. P2 TaxID=3423955 RepID=UPI003D66B0DD
MDGSIGAYEAKTHLSALLDRVARGESLTITRNGKPVARLVPAEAAPARPESGRGGGADRGVAGGVAGRRGARVAAGHPRLDRRRATLSGARLRPRRLLRPGRPAAGRGLAGRGGPAGRHRRGRPARPGALVG